VARLLQTLLDSLTVGSLYALIALGYTMVYGILQFINFAHSDIFMLGAWFSYTISKKLGWAAKDPPVWSAPFILLATMAICGSIGFAIERLAYKPLRKAPRLNVLITAIGVSLLIENVGQLNEVWIPYVSTRVRMAAAPADWQAAPVDSGTIAAFVAPRADGDAESPQVTLAAFPERDAYRGKGDGWPDENKTTEVATLPAGPLTAEVATGTYTGDLKPHEGYALVATCIDGKDETLTAWLLGPEKSVAKGKEAFLSWAGTIHLVGPLHCFGTQPQSMPPLIPDVILKKFVFTESDGSTEDVNITLVNALVIGISIALMLALQWLVFKTKLGLGMRAVSYDTRTASLMGINVDLVISFTFVIGSALAAAAGLLFSLKYSGLKQPADSTWVLLGLKAFVAAVVGGIGNVRGAVLGGILIGLLEQCGVAYVSPQLRDVYVFALLILVLLVKPTGILGKPVVEKV
jgi:branched-subunit amino acid ABC-type transport system permease component